MMMEIDIVCLYIYVFEKSILIPVASLLIVVDTGYIKKWFCDI